MGHRIKWAAKLPPHLLREFYTRSAMGILDEELIDNVGLRLYMRCESIVMVTEKAFYCPECRNKVSIMDTDDVQLEISCTYCGFVFTVAEFFESHRHRDLWKGNAGECFEKYYHKYLECKTPNEKLIMIDTLIHSFHIDARTGMPNRAAGNNLIEGSLAQVVELLDNLSGIQPENDVLFKETSTLMWKRRRGKL